MLLLVVLDVDAGLVRDLEQHLDPRHEVSQLGKGAASDQTGYHLNTVMNIFINGSKVYIQGCNPTIIPKLILTFTISRYSTSSTRYSFTSSFAYIVYLLTLPFNFTFHFPFMFPLDSFLFHIASQIIFIKKLFSKFKGTHLKKINSDKYTTEQKSKLGPDKKKKEEIRGNTDNVEQCAVLIGMKNAKLIILVTLFYCRGQHISPKTIPSPPLEDYIFPFSTICQNVHLMHPFWLYFCSLYIYSTLN